jgi:hypothetical protein
VGFNEKEMVMGVETPIPPVARSAAVVQDFLVRIFSIVFIAPSSGSRRLKKNRFKKTTAMLHGASPDEAASARGPVAIQYDPA